MRHADFRVPRKARYRPPKNDRVQADETVQTEAERWLADWRNEPAYVLLGDPGSGKTESLRAEAEAVGGVLVSSALIQADVAPSVGTDALVFIDAVDEVKGSGSGNIVGAIARYLLANGKPRFRIACREADWRVDADRELLEAAAPGGQVKELHLSPLSDEDIQTILTSRSTEVPNAQAFIEQAQTQGVQDWLRNPLLLNLMVEAVAKDGLLPDSRLGIYEAACYAMAQEHNDKHLEQQALTAGVVQNVIEDAGGLCALLLLSGQSAISKSAKPATQVLALPALPKDLKLQNTEQAVKSKLFSTEDDLIRPRHRTIAEFLGAQALAKRIEEGLPLSRVLALVQGHDGVPVESMRGLCAWLAVHLNGDQRRLVLEADPLGFIINGDAAALTHDERMQLIRALADLSKQNPWFRNSQWESHPFGPLATPDMQDVFVQALAQPGRSNAHQVFISCVLDALQHAPQPMPALAPLLAQWVTNLQGLEDVHIRNSAYKAWCRHVAFEQQGEQIKTWLKSFQFSSKEFKYALLCNVLEQHAHLVTAQDLYEWLDVDLDPFSSALIGQNESVTRIVECLKKQPQKIKEVGRLCWLNADTNYAFALWRLDGVPLPSDWLHCEMAMALEADDERLVRHLLLKVMNHVKHPYAEFDLPTDQEVTVWVEQLSLKHRDIQAWIQAAEAEQLASQRTEEGWKKELSDRKARNESEREYARQQRRKEIQPYLEKWPEKLWPADLLNDIARAYEKHFHNIQGETPEARVADFLGTDLQQDVNRALQAIDDCLTRKDLPIFNAVIKRYEKSADGRLNLHPLTLPALLAASRACEQDSQAWRAWPVQTQHTLIAFWLSYDLDYEPAWVAPLGAACPDVLAPVLSAFAKSKFKQKSFQSLTGLSHLSKEPTWQTLAERVVPELLASFPTKVGEDGNRVLNRDLLTALHKLPPSQAKALVEKKLALKSLDSGQRIAWLVAWLPYESVRAVEELVAFVDNAEAQHRRVVILHHSLKAQAGFTLSMLSLPVACVQRLIELMAPLTPCCDLNWKGGTVTDDMEREDMVRALFSNLGNNPSFEAATALQALATNPKLNPWQRDAQFQFQQQQRLQREAAFKPASVQAVAKVLCKQSPANANDVLAMVVDHLKGLEAELRGDPTFQLRHFWNGDTGTKKAKKAKRDRVPSIENDCTLELLALLRPRLHALSVTLEPESQAANQKRMDLRATCVVEGQRITLPIEAKKEDHENVWTAWRDQLQNLYTIDPAAKRNGIYLVYWFGLAPESAPPLDGSQPAKKPTSAKEMQAMLEERIPAKDRHIIKVVVLDLSWPDL
jgi:hypothetical protein